MTQTANGEQVCLMRVFVQGSFLFSDDIRRPSAFTSEHLPADRRARRSIRREFLAQLPGGSILRFDSPRLAVAALRRRGFVPVVWRPLRHMVWGPPTLREGVGRVRVLR